jgi:hypothetical protein
MERIIFFLLLGTYQDFIIISGLGEIIDFHLFQRMCFQIMKRETITVKQYSAGCMLVPEDNPKLVWELSCSVLKVRPQSITP